MRFTVSFMAGITLALGASALPAAAMAADSAKLVEVCANCHGKAGASMESDVPIIGGYSVEFLTNNMKAYKNKDRDCPETKYRSGPKKGQKTTMCQIVKDFSTDDMQQIAKYFSKQKFVRAKQKFDATLAKKGKDVHDQYCEKCHSDGGTRSDDDAGLPAGQWIPYLRQAFDEFANGKRPIAKKMKAKLDEVDKSDIEALVQYYASFQ